MATNPRIYSILKKLEVTKAKDSWPFGAEEHCFRLEPVLTGLQVADFEAQYHIQLPSEYREFIMQVGNGGAGPAYGLFPLDETVKYRGNTIPANFLRSPFPYQTFYNPYDDPSLAEYWKRSNNRQLTKEEYETRKFKEVTGTLVLCHEGCGCLHLLVVSGEASGQMWLDATVSDGGYVPLGIGFLDWYEKWLDHALAGGDGVWWMSKTLE
ncbi:MAG: SMI1/KNR4 family protein [Gemmatales bacterium]